MKTVMVLLMVAVLVALASAGVFMLRKGRSKDRKPMARALARLYEFDAAASGAIRQNLDIDVFAQESALALRPWALVQEDAPGTPADGLLRQWPAPDTGLHKHYGYAFQWFSLCALTIFLYAWFQFIRPRYRPAQASR